MPKPQNPFFSLYSHGFVRIAVAIPEVRVADPRHNASRTLAAISQAAQRGAAMVAFPELGLSAYSCEDLFHQQALLDASRQSLAEILEATRNVQIVSVIGLPLQVEGLLFNCAAVLHRGAILGVVPKTYLPNYREFYERRQFVPGYYARAERIELCGQRDVPFGSRLLFSAENLPGFVFHVEICEDLWVPIPPSSHAALSGATVLVNLSASNVILGKDEYRRELVMNQSGRCLAAYIYSAAGAGESTTDLAWDGHGMICENATMLAETERFARSGQLVTADVDLDRLVQDRMRQTSFSQAVSVHREKSETFRTVSFALELPAAGYAPLERRYERFPYVSSDPAVRDARCRDVFAIQVQGLATRLRAARADRMVIGVSGGLDSTHALLVCARVADVMDWPRERIVACTMPGFATTARTLDQARRLMAAIGCEALEIDIRPSCMQMLKDIGHAFAQGEPVHDITFENVQAGERTSHLFRLANQRGGLVIGTSDLSELALGWCTYGVGDHMAHYHVNASVPKTLLQHLIRWVAGTGQLGAATSGILREVLATEISPELVPGEDEGHPAQRTQDVIGPYELQDFHLYYTLRFGYAPAKVAFLAWNAWHDRGAGAWPDIPESERHAYGIAEIKRWLGVFLKRFFQYSQYKRSCMPNAPKVGSGGSLSPRGDWRAPSDGEAAVWLKALEQVPDRESSGARAAASPRPGSVGTRRSRARKPVRRAHSRR
ncbi:MAG TPA: NAD(+) synthase [Burkholderiales bacterium]|nr:NAD(+) synthase [Burkholderiales bacterium]